MLKPPTEQDIFNFVATTNGLDRIPLSMDAIQSTWNQKGQPNPYAQGHFRAMMYILHNLIPSGDFPAKEASLLGNVQDTETGLYWLRELHHKMADPLVNHPLVEDDPNAPTSSMIGRYRSVQALAVTKPCPPPEAIAPLMHIWLKDYTQFHAQIKDKIDNPYAFDRETAYGVIRKAYEANLFFCAIQPLACLNQRMGRLVENVFRLAWNLPLKLYLPNSKDAAQLPKDIQLFQDNQTPELIQRIKNVASF